MTGESSRKFSLQLRLVLAAAAAISLTASVGVFCLYKLKQIATQTSEITDVWVPSIQALAEVRARSLALRVAQFDILAETDSAKLPGLLKNCDALASEMFIYNKAFSNLIQDDASQAGFDAYTTAWDAFVQSNDDFMKRMKESKVSEARVALEKGTAEFSKSQSLLKDLDSLSYKGSMHAKEQAEEMRATTVRIAVVALPVIFILSMVFIGVVTRRTTRTMNGIAEDLRQIAEQLLIKGDSLANTSNQLSDSTTKEAEALHEALTTTNSINAKVSENSTRARDASTAIEETREFANNGRNSLGQVTSAMSEIDSSNQRILEHVENNNANMQAIIEIMKSIEGKTKVINDIVFQTRLLSFNASVEAARAGEAGKGFAVVAEEIAKLAEMSGGAAQEIGVIIDSSSHKVQKIVADTRLHISSAVAESDQKIKLGVTLSEESLMTLERIVKAAERASGMAAMISSGSSEQAQGVNEISIAMAQLTETTQANSTLAETTASESKALGSDSAELSAAVLRLQTEVQGRRKQAAA